MLGAIAVEIFSESWARWQNPQPVKSMEMLVIAAIGLVANLVVAFVLSGHDHDHEHEENEREDLNVRSAFLHVVGDAVSSVGVILAAAIIWHTGWAWVDPLMSALIGVLILLSSWRVLKSSLHILVEGVPEGLSIEKVGQAMVEVAGMNEVHDLHVWSLCSGHVALSAHIVTADQPLAESDGLMADLKRCLLKFGIEHTTIQFECGNCGQGAIVCPA
jgi:cobalt-zinc-cadmium efflux system protein